MILFSFAAWPDVLSSIGFLIKITEDMSNATRHYATLTEEKLNEKKFYETNDLSFFIQEVYSFERFHCFFLFILF